ncbi:unnamed protein product (macronuclear) [Paramecium tetraurelia]|uniref:Uncharacterized protein n=1 Tax=Paramecium tetraurelia TaxID=5888 RepID=A0DLG6_PARTE|nr:uncharacterized protein GSPATT00018200001 [Paramecium tetraurelia]CAK83883.1 unnamed protein product [Paramecium tetraurelia]|eukprot:XP_001451280.1 hypothetical protein (macronuclear) [Paramecium tetraurelia strain d4-2]
MLPSIKKNKDNRSSYRLKTEGVCRYPRSNSFLGQISREPIRQRLCERGPLKEIQSFDKEIKLLEQYEKKLDAAYMERLRIQLYRMQL